MRGIPSLPSPPANAIPIPHSFTVSIHRPSQHRLALNAGQGERRDESFCPPAAPRPSPAEGAARESAGALHGRAKSCTPRPGRLPKQVAELPFPQVHSSRSPTARRALCCRAFGSPRAGRADPSVQPRRCTASRARAPALTALSARARGDLPSAVAWPAPARS